MTADDAKQLRQILLEVVIIHEAQVGRQDEFGQRYTLTSRLNGTIEVQLFGVVGLSSMARRFQD